MAMAIITCSCGPNKEMFTKLALPVMKFPGARRAALMVSKVISCEQPS